MACLLLFQSFCEFILSLFSMDEDDELMMLFFRVMIHVWSCGIPDHIIVITPIYSL